MLLLLLLVPHRGWLHCHLSTLMLRRVAIPRGRLERAVKVILRQPLEPRPQFRII
jgi:hypothetical protein